MHMRRDIRAWLDGFAACVRRKDFAGGRRFFHRRVYCFGSYAGWCTTLDALVDRQWRRVWPHIARFRFQLHRTQSHIDAGGRLACVMALWHSVGYRRNGRPFRRDGRVTILLTRRRRRDPWKALHTHYSLIPGTPHTTARRSRRVR